MSTECELIAVEDQSAVLERVVDALGSRTWNRLPKPTNRRWGRSELLRSLQRLATL